MPLIMFLFSLYFLFIGYRLGRTSQFTIYQGAWKTLNHISNQLINQT